MDDILSAIVFRNGYFLGLENKCNLLKKDLFILDGGGRGKEEGKRESPADSTEHQAGHRA